MSADSRSNDRRTPLPVRRALDALGQDLATWRKLRGITQAQLADRAGVERRTVARLEHGDGSVSTENHVRILRALGILDLLSRSLDPYESDIGRLRADEQLPQRVRPRNLTDRA